MKGRTYGASSRAFNPQAMTRMEFATIDVQSIDYGMAIRSYGFDKWLIVDPSGRDVSDLPPLTRSQFAHTAESELPKKILIKYKRKPLYIIEEVTC